MLVLVQVSEDVFLEIPSDLLPKVRMYTRTAANTYTPNSSPVFAKLVDESMIRDNSRLTKIPPEPLTHKV